MSVVSVNTIYTASPILFLIIEPDTSADSETEFQINGPIAAVFAAVLGTLACASLVLLATFLSASLCCKQNREKG